MLEGRTRGVPQYLEVGGDCLRGTEGSVSGLSAGALSGGHRAATISAPSAEKSRSRVGSGADRRGDDGAGGILELKKTKFRFGSTRKAGRHPDAGGPRQRPGGRGELVADESSPQLPTRRPVLHVTDGQATDGTPRGNGRTAAADLPDQKRPGAICSTCT